LVSRCPNILTDDWPVTKYKINYAYYEMGINMRLLSRSKLLKYPIRKILTRHKMLERSGLYKKPDPELIQHIGSDDANPLIKNIFESSDTIFIKNVAKLSFQEFEAFQLLIENEISEEADELDDENSEDSDDDD
ncbi:hypothetical protein HELRODRAFT_145121, partial [Helobdella robusta]|uniref:Uncharacterized protein n=1 Tax=Helobdella robusta TaxID=6412 RepID=T1EJI7_HELRO